MHHKPVNVGLGNRLGCLDGVTINLMIAPQSTAFYMQRVIRIGHSINPSDFPMTFEA